MDAPPRSRYASVSLRGKAKMPTSPAVTKQTCQRLRTRRDKLQDEKQDLVVKLSGVGADITMVDSEAKALAQTIHDLSADLGRLSLEAEHGPDSSFVDAAGRRQAARPRPAAAPKGN